ncbi:GNAT family N-acetyltransferase [Aeromicrobium fastidiosum]|uniref:GNAT family N-acetyltransferase n=1 Tax=Aeromicrobium fastidiosum TaxID=52699 RepID=A0A641AKF3_9ACTN|nr:GNAT family protein [Aeromicrobium fastidiosum]KAA1373637.1 GNAT family N-acetyltransferase [Aeromicrobium fastidiosum]MBP2391191.1 ribosomal-protein-alanine N-acetyltransferase [Aeromicrobium fastidiosum]
MSIRLASLDDAPAIASLLTANRDFLAPWEPLRDESWFTADGQRAAIAAVLAHHEAGTSAPYVVLDDDDAVVGRMTLSGIVRGALQSASLGYWVAEHANGRGLATAAVRDIVRSAFDDLGLHRVQADTLLHNVASQRVLGRVGFIQYGVAPSYLRIAGRWQDCAMWQLLADE